MKKNELPDLNDKQLREGLSEERQGLTKLVLSHAVSPLENPMKIRVARKQIAKILTEIKKRSLIASEK